jgi:uncharacterized protein YrzB (UPF0473 family)
MAEDTNMTEGLGTVTLTLEDDQEVECMILSIYPAAGNEYIALLPLGDDGEPDEDSEVYLYRYIDHGEDQDPELQNIDDDEEYEAAADAFDEMLDQQEFEEADASEET